MQTSAQLKTDVLIVGGGPAGLACAIHLARLGGGNRRIILLEKSALPGAHLLSGAVMRPDALRNLLTEEEFAGIPPGTAVTRDTFHALTPSHAIRVPFVPPKMRMNNLPLVSACELGRALWGIAESLGVELLAAQTADGLIWEGDRVAGVHCAEETLLADTTVLAEGPAGLLTRDLLRRHPELRGPNLQTHALGLKELIELPVPDGRTGQACHTFGWPLGCSTYGGGFIYHLDDTHVALGLALAIDYTDPLTHPHLLFRQWKQHPFVQRHIAGGKGIEYGARLVPEGGLHSCIGMNAPGAMLIGDSAGLVDTVELKGLHLAIESGMAAACAIHENRPIRTEEIPSLDGLRKTANVRAAFRAGLPAGMLATGLAWLSGGRIPWGRIPQRNERTCLKPARNTPVTPPPSQNALDLNLDSDLFLAHLRYHEGNEHIEIRDLARCRECFERFAAPCLRFCPAGVYEDKGDQTIRVRVENCLQCRCCTLKCPFDNIDWQMPIHGDGPAYRRL